MRRGMVVGAVLVALLSGAAVRPAVASESSPGAQFGWGMAAVGANLLYMPLKLVYATLGGITGSLGYLLTLGNADVAQAVWYPTVGGTYVISPDMLRGEEPILFSGESRE